MKVDGSWAPAPPSGGDPVRLFEELAAELEEGAGDPEAFFAAHPGSEHELRELYRGWLRVDALLRDLSSGESLAGAVRQEFGSELDPHRLEAILSRLVVSGFDARYELGDELGHGGMGVVRRVTDRVLGRELAMKVIRPVEPARRARLLRRFLEEAEVISRLEHPGIVPIHELGLDSQGQVYFTMPLVRGRTLQEILRLAREGREGWTLARILEVLLKACDAVAYAHSRGVLHRDLKPANVMVGPFGVVYVMDWGLARSVGTPDQRGEAGDENGALTLEGEVLGTPAYMAPEQALGRSERLDERADVYALGAILYEALAGVRPYGECSSAEALERLGKAAPPGVDEFAKAASAELCAIVGRAMARDREERYPSVAALAGDLRAYLEGRVVRAHRTGPWIEARKWVGRNRRLAAALAAAVLALAAGLVASLVFLGRAERERANVFRLAQTRTLASLIERAEALWPPHPERIEALRAWQADARALVDALEPDPSGAPGLRAQLAELAARERSWGEEDRWWHGELAKLVAGIEELADPERGLMGEGLGPHGFGIARRLALVESMREESESPAVQERWREAAELLRADPRFRGLELVPQVGLVPLGRDPDSGLLEFAHLLSGTVPFRDAAGRLVLADDSALILVLVPPGEFVMGSQVDDPAGPNFTLHMGKGQFPPHRRSVPAFLLAKHEMTQAQWARCTGANPSTFAAAPGAARLPVETVTWDLARRELGRAGLRLPSEAEWEYACRAGSTGDYYWGDNLLDVVRHGNVKDEGGFAPTGTPSSYVSSPLRPKSDYEEKTFLLTKDAIPGSDGFSELAPVGSFPANPFGLHDTIGNVFEWCADRYDLYPGARGTSYEDVVPAREMRVMRGGAYNRSSNCRSADRGRESPDFAYQSIGVRPARGLDP